MYKFIYSREKDQKLRQQRGISFDEIIAAIEDGCIIDILSHPQQDSYPNQNIYLLDIDGYVWLVPYIKDKENIFLKTAFPSRKHTKQYKKQDLKDDI